MSREGTSPLGPPPKPFLIVLSGLSGAGKDAVLARLRQSARHLEFIVTMTTRPPRAGEKDGGHYHFVTGARFQELIDRQELLEWAEVYGHRYGGPREPFRLAPHKCRDVFIF